MCDEHVEGLCYSLTECGEHVVGLCCRLTLCGEHIVGLCNVEGLQYVVNM